MHAAIGDGGLAQVEQLELGQRFQRPQIGIASGSESQVQAMQSVQTRKGFGVNTHGSI